jgi:hypothetical protein
MCLWMLLCKHATPGTLERMYRIYFKFLLDDSMLVQNEFPSLFHAIRQELLLIVGEEFQGSRSVRSVLVVQKKSIDLIESATFKLNRVTSSEWIHSRLDLWPVTRSKNL